MRRISYELLTRIIDLSLCNIIFTLRWEPTRHTKNTFKFALFLSKCIFLVLILLGFYEGFQSGLTNNNQIKVIFGIIGITLTLVYCVWKSYMFFKKINDDF